MLRCLPPAVMECHSLLTALLRFCKQTVGPQPQYRPTKGAHQARTMLTSTPGPSRTQTASRHRQGPSALHSTEAQHTCLSSPPALWAQGGLPVWAEDSPVWLGEEELRPISCHGGRVSGVGGQLGRCPLRVRVVGLDKWDVAQQGGVGGAENLLSHLLRIVWRHLQVRGERGRGSAEPTAFKHYGCPTLTLTPTPPLSLVPLSCCGVHKRQGVRMETPLDSTTVHEIGK